MEEKKSLVSLRNALEQQGEEASKIYRDYIKILAQENTPVFCVNRSTGKNRKMPFKALYDNNDRFWQQPGSWEYFLEKEEFAKVKEKVAAQAFLVPNIEATEQQENKSSVKQGYGEEAKIISAMTLPEKVERLEKNRQRLNDLVANKVKDPQVITEALVDSTKDAAIINHAVLLDAMQIADDEAKNLTQDLVTSTCEMVKASTHLVSDEIFHDELMHTLVEKSNGTIVQHMTRVYLSGVSFMTFYNKLVSSSSAIIKLRVSFAAKYRNYYHTLLPHISLEDITLERIFYGGMRVIPPDLFSQWAVGFLIHDIGKASAVEYHEGEEAYNRNIVIEHVKLGFTSVMTKTNYSREAGLITGYHHEYYGDNSGYGYFRAYLSNYKKSNPGAKQDYCISYELEPMLDYITLAYFPAKVLEIIDVFDSVTDPNRKYHKAMTEEEALTMMREEFILKHLKIDPILFDIFESFIRQKIK